MPPDRFRHSTSRQPAAPISDGQPLLVGPGLDGLGQVFIGGRVRRDQPGDPRDGGHQVVVVQPPEHRPGRRRELTDHQPAAGPGHPQHLGAGRPRVGDVAQPEGDRHHVEGVRRVRQRESVAGHEGQHRVGAACPPSTCRGRCRWGRRSSRPGRTAHSRFRCRRPGRGRGRLGAVGRPRWPPPARRDPGPAKGRRWPGRSAGRPGRTWPPPPPGPWPGWRGLPHPLRVPRRYAPPCPVPTPTA